MTPLRLSLFAFATLMAALTATWAQTQPATAPGTVADLEVHEWLILVADPYQTQASADGLVTSTLPDFIDTRRQKAPATQPSRPSPLGVLRLYGQTDAKVDIKLDLSGGRVLGTWPKARVRGTSMLWRDLTISSQAQRPAQVDESHWLNELRKGSAAYLTLEGRDERFILYDIEMSYPLPLKLGGGRRPDDPLQVGNAGASPLHDLVLYRPDGAGWRSATLEKLAPGRKLQPATGPATTPATAPATAPHNDPTTAAIATTQPLGIDPADVKEMLLVQTASSEPVEFLAEWKTRLRRMGMKEDDLDVIVQILQSSALDPKRQTAVYRMDEAELEKLMPLEVLPQPRRIVRVALVIVKNADPAVPAEIDELIAQLGDPKWQKREEASKALAQLGAAAKPKLQQALKSTDPEVVLRAERLLAASSGK